MKKEKMEIPTSIIKKFIIEELRSRRNNMMEGAEIEIYEIHKEFNNDDTIDGEKAWNAAGIGVLMDDIQDGHMSVQEGLKCLTSFEKNIVYGKCQEWCKNNRKIELEERQ